MKKNGIENKLKEKCSALNNFHLKLKNKSSNNLYIYFSLFSQCYKT